jgi:TonB family protein
MRSGCAFLAFVCACSGVGTAAQSTLPDTDHLWVVGARAMRQPNTQAPLQLTLNSGTRITVSPQDVHEPATILVRRAMMEQAYRAVATSLLFVLQIRELTPVSKSDVNVTLASGAVLRVPSSDVNDVRMTFLRTTLAQARSSVAPVSSERPAPAGADQDFRPSIHLDMKGVEFGPWLRRFIAQIRRNWLIPYAAMSMHGQVVMTFNVHKDGRITDVSVLRPSAIDAFNRSAQKALLTTNPTQPLPSEYPDEKAFFTVTFFFNETPPTDR